MSATGSEVAILHLSLEGRGRETAKPARERVLLLSLQPFRSPSPAALTRESTSPLKGEVVTEMRSHTAGPLGPTTLPPNLAKQSRKIPAEDLLDARR